MRMPEHLDPFPSVLLQRPFRLFGHGFEVKLSSSFTMHPETVVWAASGMSFQQAIDALSPDYGRAMKALWRGVRGTKLSPTTLANIRRLSSSPIFAGVSRKPTLDELLSSIPPLSPWQLILQEISELAGSELYEVVQPLAQMDALVDRIKSISDQGDQTQAEELLRQEIERPVHYWTPLKLPMQTIHVLDATLRVLAALERKRTAISDNLRESSASPALALMADGRMPLGHWLVRLQDSSGCSSLSQLSEKLGGIDLDRLKDWSSGRHLLKRSKAMALLAELGDTLDADLEIRSFYKARFFSFLIEFVICTTEGAPTSWPEAQVMVRNRYRELQGSAIPA